MPRRFVVALRADRPELGAALRARKTAEALGGSLCAWGGLELAFSFDEADLDEVLGLARSVTTREEGGFAVGISCGDLEVVEGATALAELAWGAALVEATLLARATPAGAVTIEDVASAGFEARVSEPRTVSVLGRAVVVRTLSPGSLLSAPPSVRRSTGLSDVPPSPEAREAAEATVAAIRSGDLSGLERQLADLRGRGASEALITRLTGLAALGRGATLDALRTLRVAAESATDPASRTRAHLALAVALGAAGRSDEALLAALRALAAAREADDRFGERASARYLAQLSAAAGFPEAAGAWDRAALRAVGSSVDEAERS